MFASAKALDQKGWRGKLARVADRLFFGRRPYAGDDEVHENEDFRLMQLREQEERHNREIEKILSSYEHSVSNRGYSDRASQPFDEDHSRVSAPSMYSQITGSARRGPEPRLPMRSTTLVSRFSASTNGSSSRRAAHIPRASPSDAELYAQAYRDSRSDPLEQSFLTLPHETEVSRNPFRI